MISWEEIKKHLPDEYDDERHEVLRHEIKWYEYEIKDLEDEIEVLNTDLETKRPQVDELEKEIKKLQEKIDDLISDTTSKIAEKQSKLLELNSEYEKVYDEFLKYEKMVNLVELELMYGWKKGNVIRRYDLEFGLNGPRVVGLTHGIIVGTNEDGTKYLWRRLKKSNGEPFKKVEEFKGTKYEKVADSYEEYMEKFGHLYN